MTKKLDRVKLEKLANALELIQADFDTVTAKERNEIFIKAGVFHHTYEIAGIVSRGVVENFGLKQNEVAKAAREIWDGLQDHLLVVREFLLWIWTGIYSH